MRHRILGIAFVLLLVAALTASVLQYRKAFTPATWVTLDAERAGMQLSPGADVKLRGVVVGDVRSVDSEGGEPGCAWRSTRRWPARCRPT
ncbi:hypothetical protein ACFQ1L_40155 [Phytohabitans flavus]|uniref:hypothetical protein n=1 Tax=Phytohabitans flavus TaxID=1076124 RepID=UPI0036351116